MKEKKGISLIVLIVTIIVMIIIAGAIILSLTETNIIDQAEVAVEKHNTAEVQSAVNLAYAEYLLTDRSRSAQGYVSERLVKDGVISEEDRGKYYINEDLTVEEVDPDTFIMVVDIPEDNYTWDFNSSGNTLSTGDYIIEWGDGETYTKDTQLTSSAKFRHTYEQKGIYEIKIKGEFSTFETSSMSDEDVESVIAIKSFGNLGMEYFLLDIGSRCKYLPTPNENSFKNLISFDLLSFGLVELPDKFFYGAPIEQVLLQRTTTLRYVPTNAFEGCTSLTNISSLFEGCINLKGEVPEFWTNKYNITNHTDWLKGVPIANITNYEAIPEDWR